MRRVPFLALALAALSGCDFDNVGPPQSELTGRVVYEGQTVGVRQNAVQLELWQDGFELSDPIPLHVSQEGTFAAMLFDGEYKLVRKQNNGPWLNNADTMRIEVRGSLELDVPVEPFFTIENASIALQGSTLTGSFALEQVVPGRQIERIALYVGTTRFVDSRYNARSVERNVGNTALTGVNTLTADLSALLQQEDHLFARIGVKTVGVEEMIYTPVQEIPTP
jgi:hypothetical protein